MAKVGVVLSGAGVMDGSEIHESVLTLLALAREGAEAIKGRVEIKVDGLNRTGIFWRFCHWDADPVKRARWVV